PPRERRRAAEEQQPRAPPPARLPHHLRQVAAEPELLISPRRHAQAAAGLRIETERVQAEDPVGVARASRKAAQLAALEAREAPELLAGEVERQPAVRGAVHEEQDAAPIPPSLAGLAREESSRVEVIAHDRSATSRDAIDPDRFRGNPENPSPHP